MVNEIEETSLGYLLSPEFELINSAGKPLTGGWIEVYIHGTRNKYYCYSDWNGTLHPFQIPLDSLGANIVLASPAHSYDIYIYNKFGTLVMSRYNVLPQIAGTAVISGSVNIESSDGTVNIEVTGDNNFDISIADIIDSVTANIDESIMNIEGDIAGLVSGKKDIQAPYSASGSPTKTVTSVTQDTNGVIKVTYSDIDLPQQVPNIEIESSTLDVVSSIDPETNTKTFTIDTRSVTGDASFAYGDPVNTAYIAEPHTNPVKLAGSVPTRLVGEDIYYNEYTRQFELKAGTYFVNFNVEASTNSVDDSTQQVYAEIAGNGTVHDRGTVTVDRTVSGQKSEIDLSSIIFAPNDNYVIEVDMGADSDVAIYGRISHWDIFRIDRGGISGGSVPGHEYLAGWGIEINQDDEISVDPTILDQYVTEGELATAIDNVIETVTGLIPEAQVQADWDETDPLDPSYINNKPDLDIYVTDQELIEAISGVTGTFVQEQADWTEQDSTKVDYIKNKPVEKQLVPGDNIVITESATGVIISSTGGGGASGTVQNIVEYVDSTTTPNFFNDCVALLEQGIEPAAMYNGNMYQLWHTEKNGNNYTGLGFICVHYLDFQYSGISYDHQNAYNAQLWATPDGVYPGADRMGYNYLAGDGIDAVTGVIDGEHAITYSINPTEVATAISGLLPVGTGNNILDVSDYTAEELYTKIGEMLSDGMSPVIKHNSMYYNYVELTNNNAYLFNHMWYDEDNSLGKLYAYTLIVYSTGIDEYGNDVSYYPGDYINIDQSSREISVSPSITGLMTDVASGMIPDVSNFVTETELQDGLELVTGMIPEQEDVEFLELVAGTNITITESATGIVISSTGGGGGSYTAGNGIDITNDVISVDNTVALKTDIPDVSDFVTEAEVSDMIPEQEEVEFLELTAGDNISIASGVISVTGMPDITGLATKTELQDGLELVTGLIPTDYATIEDIEESVSGKSDKFTVLTYNSSTWAEFTAALNKNTIVLCKDTQGSMNYYAVLSYYNTSSGNKEAHFIYYSHNKATNPNNPHYYRSDRDYAVVFKLTDGSNWSRKEGYVSTLMLAGNGIAESYNTETDRLTFSINPEQVASAVSGLLPVVANTAGITDIQYVQALPADPVSSVLYLIPET